MSGKVWDAESGVLRIIEFKLKYGKNPNFWEGGWFSLDPFALQAAGDTFPQTWTWPLTIQAGIGYNYDATIQVQFETRGEVFVQCIDVKVVGGKELPVDTYYLTRSLFFSFVIYPHSSLFSAFPLQTTRGHGTRDTARIYPS